MRNTVGISPFLVILSVLAGATVGGFVGALFAVPIAATAEILLEGLQAREVPIAQDPTASSEGEESLRGTGESKDAFNSPAEPDGPRQRRGRRSVKAAPDPK